MATVRNPELLKVLIETWGLSTRALASDVGCSKSLIHNLASGARDATGDYTARKIAKELQVPYSTLFLAPTSSTISEQDDEQLVDTAWVAQRLAKPEAWVRDCAAAGHIPSSRVGQHYRFRPSDISTYIAATYRATA